jgi:osmoprotectant transport system permease protein
MDRFAPLVVAHLSLTLWALMLGLAVSLPLGVAAARRPWLERPVLAVASIVQTIPGLALLAAMVPLLAGVASLGVPVRSIGPLPAILGLTLYSLLPMLRNTVVGISEIDPAVLEAARGVGMTGAQRLRLVELPLALPVLVAGFRTATVWTVGMATLATPIGAASLGDLIFAGLQTRDYGAVLLGCIGSAGLALLLDGLIRSAEAGLRTRRPALWIPPAALLGLGCAFTVASSAAGLLGGGDAPVRVGNKPFTEQYILGEILASEVRAGGADTEILGALGSNVAWDALRAGDIDLYVEYTGTIWTAMMDRSEVPEDRAELARQVRRHVADAGLVVVATLGFENAYALAVRAPEDGGPDVRRLTELAPRTPRLTIAGDYEFFDRAEWRALTDTYGFAFADRRTMDPALRYQALGEAEVDVVAAYTTDGRIAAMNLRVLEDDRGAIPPYDAVLLSRPAFLEAHPGLAERLRGLEGALDAAAMRELNRAVDLEGLTARDAADRFRR